MHCNIHGNTTIECERNAATGYEALAMYDENAAGGYDCTATQREAGLPDGEAEADKAGDNQDWNGDGENDQPGSAAARPMMRS